MFQRNKTMAIGLIIAVTATMVTPTTLAFAVPDVVYGTSDMGMIDAQPGKIAQKTGISSNAADIGYIRSQVVGQTIGPSWRTDYGTMTITSVVIKGTYPNRHAVQTYRIDAPDPRKANPEKDFCFVPDPGETCWNRPDTWDWLGDGGIFDTFLSTYAHPWWENVGWPCINGAFNGMIGGLSGHAIKVFGQWGGYWDGVKFSLRQFIWVSAFGNCTISIIKKGAWWN